MIHFFMKSKDLTTDFKNFETDFEYPNFQSAVQAFRYSICNMNVA